MEKTVKRKKAVLFVHQTGMRGGSSSALLDILSSPEINKIHPIVACSRNGPIVEDIRNIGIKVIVFRLPVLHQHAYKFMKLDVRSIYSLFKWLVLVPYAGYRICKIIRSEHVELVYLNSSVLIGCGILPRLLKVPVIYHIREFPELSGFGKYFYKFGEFVATTIFCASESIYNVLKRKFRNVILVSDWVDVDLYNKNKIFSLSVPNFNRQYTGLTIGMVSQLIPEKGIYIFLETARKLLDQDDSFYRFLFVGGFTNDVDKEIFWKKVNVLNLADCIYVTGWTNDVPNWLAEVDIVVMPNQNCEGFGKSLIEAAAMEKPIIASNLPPTNVLLKNGENCLLVEPSEVSAFVAAIRTLSHNQSLRKDLGHNARLHVVREFSKESGVRHFFDKIFFQLYTSKS